MLSEAGRRAIWSVQVSRMSTKGAIGGFSWQRGAGVANFCAPLHFTLRNSEFSINYKPSQYLFCCKTTPFFSQLLRRGKIIRANNWLGQILRCQWYFLPSTGIVARKGGVWWMSLGGLACNGGDSWVHFSHFYYLFHFLFHFYFFTFLHFLFFIFYFSFFIFAHFFSFF